MIEERREGVGRRERTDYSGGGGKRMYIKSFDDLLEDCKCRTYVSVCMRSSIFAFIYSCMYVRVYIFIYTYLYVYRHICTLVHSYMHTYKYICIYIYIHIYAYIFICMYMDIYLYLRPFPSPCILINTT